MQEWNSLAARRAGVRFKVKAGTDGTAPASAYAAFFFEVVFFGTVEALMVVGVFWLLHSLFHWLGRSEDGFGFGEEVELIFARNCDGAGEDNAEGEAGQLLVRRLRELRSRISSPVCWLFWALRISPLRFCSASIRLNSCSYCAEAISKAEMAHEKGGVCRTADSLGKCTKSKRHSPSLRVWVACAQRLLLATSL